MMLARLAQSMEDYSQRLTAHATKGTAEPSGIASLLQSFRGFGPQLMSGLQQFARNLPALNRTIASLITGSAGRAGQTQFGSLQDLQGVLTQPLLGKQRAKVQTAIENVQRAQADADAARDEEKRKFAQYDAAQRRFGAHQNVNWTALLQRHQATYAQYQQQYAAMMRAGTTPWPTFMHQLRTSRQRWRQTQRAAASGPQLAQAAAAARAAHQASTVRMAETATAATDAMTAAGGVAGRAVAATGAATAGAGAAAGATAAVVAIGVVVKGLYDFAHHLREANERLAPFSTALMQATVRYHMGEFHRTMKLGRETGESAAGLSDALGKLENSLLPVKVYILNNLNNFMTSIINIFTSFVEWFKETVKFIHENIIEAKKALLLMAPAISLIAQVVEWFGKRQGIAPEKEGAGWDAIDAALNAFDPMRGPPGMRFQARGRAQGNRFAPRGMPVIGAPF